MFSATLSGNRNGSCSTTATRARSSPASLAQVAPVQRTRPSHGSNSRGTSEASVLLPAPVGPTSASVSPGPTSRLTSRSTGRPGS